MRDVAFQKCINPACGGTADLADTAFRCPKCGGLVDVAYDWNRLPVPKSLKGRPLAGLATASELVMAAREAAQGNVNPQLLLATLAVDLGEALCV